VFGLQMIDYNLSLLGSLFGLAAMDPTQAACCPEVWPNGRPKILKLLKNTSSNDPRTDPNAYVNKELILPHRNAPPKLICRHIFKSSGSR